MQNNVSSDSFAFDKIFQKEVKVSSIFWKVETGGTMVSSPYIAPDGTICIGSSDGNLYAIKTSNSKETESGQNQDVQPPELDPVW